MKICICTQGEQLESELSSVFGRSPYFLIVDEQQNILEVVQNTGNNESHGAGPKAAQTIMDRSIDVLITNSLGPKADVVLKKSSIKTYKQAGRTAGETLASFLNQELEELNNQE